MIYNYISGTNKLSSVIVNNQNKPYEYYSNGNLKTDGNKNICITDYDSRNLMLTNTNRLGDKSVYSYDDAGRRNAKVVNGQVEYYLADHTGRDLLIYNLDSNKVTTANIYGNGLIGAIDRGARRYYIKDHLGTIRMTLDSASTVISANDYYPFGEIIPGRSTNISSNLKKYLFTGKERDDLTNYDYFGARYYDSETGRWTTTDPLKDKYAGWSPYNYCLNDPLMLVDLDGRESTGFIDPDGNEKIINDGSNATFVTKGKGTSQHYEFAGFDPTLPGNASINETTIIQEAQNLNASNPSLIPNTSTYCNFATQNIMKTLESTPMLKGTLETGMANDMQGKLANNSAYKEVDYPAAKANAQNGGLSIYSSLAKQHGHVGSFSVGDNRDKGEVANIGAHNGFMNLRGPEKPFVYSSSASVRFFVLRRPNGY